jgi:hypothetical protein
MPDYVLPPEYVIFGFSPDGVFDYGSHRTDSLQEAYATAIMLQRHDFVVDVIEERGSSRSRLSLADLGDLVYKETEQYMG